MDDDGSEIGVDAAALAAWMDRRGLGSGPLTDKELIAGGTQNVLLRFRRDGREYVLRRPPLHKRPNSDETMRREARLLAALAGSDVPHPALIAAEADDSVIGASFYLMEAVVGFNAGMGLPEPHASDRGMQHAMGLSMADAIAALGRVDHQAVGLGDFGKPDGWLERQVGRWRAQLASYDAFEGYPGADVPGVERVADWLDAHQPEHWRPGLIHGDFHFSNVLIRPDRGELAAIVDWELTTIGDPLLDLGHLLVTWPTRPHGVASALSTANLPGPQELIERYAAGSDRDLSSLAWYRVLACYRLGIILEGTNARADAGLAPRETGDMLHAHTLALFEQALDLID
ncbi:MAG: aminoglycoside phosphotransferase [Ilumatobacteraceae bacterium]|nr:aminoglycoside phosphotransferase [Ilumatobacteraceae bacterium]